MSSLIRVLVQESRNVEVFFFVFFAPASMSGAEESSRLRWRFPICGGQIMRWYLRAGAEQRSRTGASIRRESPSHPDGGVGFAEVRPPGSLQV